MWTELRLRAICRFTQTFAFRLADVSQGEGAKARWQEHQSRLLKPWHPQARGVWGSSGLGRMQLFTPETDTWKGGSFDTLMKKSLGTIARESLFLNGDLHCSCSKLVKNIVECRPSSLPWKWRSRKSKNNHCFIKWLRLSLKWGEEVSTKDVFAEVHQWNEEAESI